MSIDTQTNQVLRWLANLSCALEDHQAFMESDEPKLADVSKGHAFDAIQGIRAALDSIERQLQPALTLAERVERAA